MIATEERGFLGERVSEVLWENPLFNPLGEHKKMSREEAVKMGHTTELGEALCSGKMFLPFLRLLLPPWQGQHSPSDLPCTVFANILKKQLRDKTFLEGGWLSSLGFLTGISELVPGCARGAQPLCVLPVLA